MRSADRLTVQARGLNGSTPGKDWPWAEVLGGTQLTCPPATRGLSTPPARCLSQCHRWQMSCGTTARSCSPGWAHGKVSAPCRPTGGDGDSPRTNPLQLVPGPAHPQRPTLRLPSWAAHRAPPPLLRHISQGGQKPSPHIYSAQPPIRQTPKGDSHPRSSAQLHVRAQGGRRRADRHLPFS